MFGLLKRVAHAGRRVFGAVGDVVRKWGDTSNAVSRTLHGHGPALKSFSSEMGSHFGPGGELAAHLVNKGIDTAAHLTGRVGEKLNQLGTTLHPDR
jgi:hypothetical protein